MTVDFETHACRVKASWAMSTLGLSFGTDEGLRLLRCGSSLSSVGEEGCVGCSFESERFQAEFAAWSASIDVSRHLSASEKSETLQVLAVL